MMMMMMMKAMERHREVAIVFDKVEREKIVIFFEKSKAVWMAASAGLHNSFLPRSEERHKRPTHCIAAHNDQMVARFESARSKNMEEEVEALCGMGCN